ncbi:MAG: colanic acid biosynthesis glycosyltransferase WcaL [Planctomycetes bacterium]|nr:colanic acid biosynthesis glycosyltransferase WcaL [Planctomycetota bacterium]
MAEGIRVAYIVPEFPKLSETAILNEALGVLRAKVDVRIFAFARPREKRRHPQSQAPVLRARVHYIRKFGWSGGRGLAVLRSLWCVFRYPNQSAHIRSYMREHRTPARYLAGLTRLADFFRMSDRNVVHVQFGHVARVIAPLTDWLGLPLVVSFRGWDASSFPVQVPKAYGALFKSSRLVLARCEAMADDLAGVGCPREKLVVHHSGIDLDGFPFTPRPPVEHGKVKFLTVGRLVDKKGIPAAIGALRRCLRSHPNAAELRVIGGGPKEADLKQLVTNLRLDPHVKFLGETTQEGVAEEMANCHLFVLPCQQAWDYDREGIPNAIMEAMASGLPVLSTRHAGIPECIEHGKSGLLVPEKDVDALADVMMELIEAPERWEEMGRAGRRRIEEEFNATRQAERLVDIYREVIGSK